MVEVIVIMGFDTEYVLALLTGTISILESNPLMVIWVDNHHHGGAGAWFNMDSVDLGSKGLELPCLLDRMPLKADKTQWQTSGKHGDP